MIGLKNLKSGSNKQTHLSALYFTYPGESSKTVQVLHKAEHLQADGWHDDEKAGCEYHQAA